MTDRIDDPVRRAELGRRSRERAVADFTDDHLAARLAAVLDDLA